jgi:hypothetical protein
VSKRVVSFANARLVHTHDRTAKLLDAGDVTTAHVDAMARAARDRESCFEEHEETLLDAARVLPVEQFRTVARRWRLLADDVATDAGALKSFEQRHLHCSVTFHGTVRIDGVLDPEGGARLLTALDSLMERDAHRPAAQRRADALVALASGTQPTAAIDVVVDAESLAGQMPADIVRARSDLTGVGPVAPSTVRRLACDGMVGRVVRRGRSEVLDVGRRHRLATSAQRRAVRARDGGCVSPGCDRRVDWCDVHHVDSLGRHRPYRHRQPRSRLPASPRRLPRRPLEAPTIRRRHRRSRPAVGRGCEKVGTIRWLVAAFHALHVEVDGEQVLHVERVHGEIADDEIVVLLDLNAVVADAVALARIQPVVDFGARVVQQTQVVVSG